VQVFISWSGPTSRAVAEALRDWLPNVIQNLQPFMSSDDIAAGNRWQAEIANRLQSSIFGLVCVTKDNQHSAWLNFEAGAIAKSIDVSRVVPLAIDLTESEIEQPLAQFQAQPLSETGIRKTVRSINSYSTEPLSEESLNRAFVKWWPELDGKLSEARSTPTSAAPPARSDRAVLEEILDVVRSMARHDQSTDTTQRERTLLRFLSTTDIPEGTQFEVDMERMTVQARPPRPLSVERRAAIQRRARQRGIIMTFGEPIPPGAEGDDVRDWEDIDE